jgi:hypothetical protein
MRTIASILGVALVGLTSTTHASLTVYTDPTAYAAAAHNNAHDTFDDLVPGVEVFAPLQRTASGYRYTVTTALNSDFIPGTDTGTDIWLSSNLLNDTLIFTLHPGTVNAIGGYFFATDIAGNSTAAPGLTVTGIDSDGMTRIDHLAAPSTTSFLGFISTASLTSLTVTADQAPNDVWTTVNDLALGGPLPVPEPSMSMLLLAGLLALGVRARSHQ